MRDRETRAKFYSPAVVIYVAGLAAMVAGVAADHGTLTGAGWLLLLVWILDVHPWA